MKIKERVTDDGEVVPAMNEAGQELPDPVPVAPPVGFVESEPLHLRIRRMVQLEHARMSEASEYETEEEADDFIIPGDEADPREDRFALLPGHEWEENYEPPSSFAEMHKRLVEAGWTPPAKAKVPAEGETPSVAPKKAVEGVPKADANPSTGG